MILIEFKLHRGKIPYFVLDYLSCKVNNRYYGIAEKDESNYLPKTVIILTREEFIANQKLADMYKSSSRPSSRPSSLSEERELMSEEEKILFIENWIDKHLPD